MLSRRELLSMVPGTLVAVAPPVSRASLKEAAARQGRSFGSCLRAEALMADTELCRLAARECSTLTPELELKWAMIEPARDVRLFGPLDATAGFARAHRMRLRGHTLIWHRSVPEWARTELTGANGWDHLARHFSAVIPRHAGLIDEWDVINEPIEPTDGVEGGLRRSPFLEAFGPSYIRRALDEARRLAPKARLLINEYGLEYDTPEEEARRRAFLKLLEELVAQGAPIDGIGLQAHLNLGKGPLRPIVLDAFLTSIAALGLSIRITELDVKEHDYTLASSQRDLLVADAVRQYLDVVLAHAAVVGVTTWGLSDRQSWLEVTPEDRARHPGAWQDGSSPGFNRGLPFDSSLVPKPMYKVIHDALETKRGSLA